MNLLQAIQEVVDRISTMIRQDQVVDSMLVGGVAVYIHVTTHARKLSEGVDLIRRFSP